MHPMSGLGVKPFRFRVATNLRFGRGESEKLGEELKELGFSKAAALVDAGVARHPLILKALESVKAAGLALDVYEAFEPEPSYDYLEAMRARVGGKGYDVLVGIGGGSAMDLAKGLAVLLANDGPALSYRGFPKLKNRPLPVVEIPTTAGTGSEVTYNAVFNDNAQKKKLGINSILNFPVCAIIDPLITVDCPRSVTVSSGVDALVHALESYVHKDHTPISRLYSVEAFRLLFNNLHRVTEDPRNPDIRAALALGAYYAATALMNSGSGPTAAFSYPLGAVYKVPHGYAGAAFLPSITRINVRKGYRDYARLYDLIDGADVSLPTEEKCRRFADAVQALMDKLGVPPKLSHYKLGPKDIDFMIGQYDVLKAGIAQNPIEITKDDVVEMMTTLA